MRNRDLNAAVAAANPVDSERAAALALPVDPTALLDAVAGEPPPAGSAPARRPLATLVPLVALLAIVVAAGVFTPPGKAVTSWVGERLGFGEPGEPGGPPALRQLNESWAKGTGAEGRPQHVLIVGPVTGQERSRYEFITFKPAQRADRPTWPDGPCFKLDLTQVRSMFSQGCGTLRPGSQFAYLGVSVGYGHAYAEDGEVRFSDELLHLSGRAGPRVAAIEATVNGREIPVQMRPVPDHLLERFDLGRPFSFFIGFFSGVPRGGTVEVMARGADGEVLGRAKTELVDLVESKRLACQMMLKGANVKRLPRPGLEECRAVLGASAP